MRKITALLFLVGCGHNTAPRVEQDPSDLPPPEQEPTPETPRPAGPERADPLPAPEAPQLPDDGECESPREARLEPDAAGVAGGDAITEYLDEAGCVAVRFRLRVEGRTATTITEVPGSGGWFPQPSSYVDLTPRAQTDVVTVDADGRTIETTQDLDSDGTIEQRETHVWDGDRLVERRREGPQDWLTRWAFDADGNEVWVETISDGTTRVTEREFDEAGRAVLERASVDGEVRSLRTARFDGDKPLERRHETAERTEVTLWVYRADGTLQRREWTRTQAGTAQIVEHHDFSLNAAGQQVEHYRRDDRNDGTFEAQRWTTSDAKGREILVRLDNDGDGVAEWAREQRWDDRDRMIWWENRENGVRILLRAWTFDGDEWLESRQFPAGGRPGTLVEKRRVEGDVEIVDTLIEGEGAMLIATRRTRYHTPSLLAEQLVDRGGDGTVDEWVTQDVDAEDRVVRYERQRDGMISWRTKAYDHTGQLAEERGNWVPDGPELLLRQLIRDEAGNVVYHLQSQGEGTPYRAVTDYLD